MYKVMTVESIIGRKIFLSIIPGLHLKSCVKSRFVTFLFSVEIFSADAKICSLHAVAVKCKGFRESCVGN